MQEKLRELIAKLLDKLDFMDSEGKGPLVYQADVRELLEAALAKSEPAPHERESNWLENAIVEASERSGRVMDARTSAPSQEWINGYARGFRDGLSSSRGAAALDKKQSQHGPLLKAIEQRESLAKEHKTIEEIQIDRPHYTVTMKHMTGLQLRHVPIPPIGPDRDLFEVVPGGSDRKIGDEQVVEIRNGLRFFTAPAQINPGREE